MTPADRKLKEFMQKNAAFFTMMAPEFAEQFYGIVREQALADVADYITRIANATYSQMRRKGPEPVAKGVRKILYGIAAQVRSQGRSGEEQVEEMLSAMKTPAVPAEAPVLKPGDDGVWSPISVLDEEDGDPA